MLDRPKLIKEIRALSDRLFFDSEAEHNIAREVWERICADPTFQYKVAAAVTPWLMPSWTGKLDDTYPIRQYAEKYSVLSVDGSQIYPDRHQGTACNMINIGEVELNYGIPIKPVHFNSVPYVFAGDEDHDMHESPTELVNCKRQEFEFIAGYKLASAQLKKLQPFNAPMVFLFDGSLIFWHLESKEQAVKRHFLSSYLMTLQQFYEEGIVIAGYISLTKSKELLNLIRIALCDFVVEGCEAYKVVDRVTDAQIARFFLHPFTRTTMFKNFSKITEQYPHHLHPHFFYMHVGNEIVRIEVPAWVAQEDDTIAMLTNIIADQTIKGRGYPVALAEAHEQAVVKGADREFFYHLINKLGFENNRRIRISQKSRKKMGIGI